MSKTKHLGFEQLGYRLGWIVVTDVPEKYSDEDIHALVNEALDDIADEMWGEQFNFWQVSGGNNIGDIGLVSDLDREPDPQRESVMTFSDLLWMCQE